MTKKKNISQNDLDVWQNYLKNPKDIVDKDLNTDTLDNKPNRFIFDLHGYTLNKANDKVKELIFFCSEKNFKEILLITGKGIHSNSSADVYSSKDLSKLRYSVPDYIRSNSEISILVSSISLANKLDGGDGALIIKLKQLQNKL